MLCPKCGLDVGDTPRLCDKCAAEKAEIESESSSRETAGSEDGVNLEAPKPVDDGGDADSEEMMGVDYSKLVPMLIKEIQTLRNRVAQLENN